MTYPFHTDNENKSAKELLKSAKAEFFAMLHRHREHDTVITMRVPVQGSDSDVLLIDAMNMALYEIDDLTTRNESLYAANQHLSGVIQEMREYFQVIRAEAVRIGSDEIREMSVNGEWAKVGNDDEEEEVS